jgi:hypothetical protein
VGWVSGVLVCVWVYFCCCSGGCICQGLQGFGLCKVVVVGLSALVSV